MVGPNDALKKEEIDDLRSLTVMEAADLAKMLEDKWGVSAAAARAVAARGNPDVNEYQTEFNLTLVSVGDRRIDVIKAVREITGLSLSEVNSLIDNLPQSLKEGVQREEAIKIRDKINKAGGGLGPDQPRDDEGITFSENEISSMHGINPQMDDDELTEDDWTAATIEALNLTIRDRILSPSIHLDQIKQILGAK